ncbi:histidine kinase dimerization/phosphoacceptor domain -containing protein [Flavobacterium sp.]|uniref:tetratricopeptide repeat-containing sensor histidine kinase n=1 Tax=Flavobacterium sp. TaxID=239 RepID=UPI0012279591|nr:histidine kinase dimerization/phosphoacceptor domain -containing protein [Flavobacterium sp.]RZJ69102.1 MAG: tetratricopeptide repeat protein [Flavobacterium sp.]
MKNFYALFVLFPICFWAQDSKIDSLQNLFSKAKTTESKLELLDRINEISDLPDAILSTQKGVYLSAKAKDKSWMPKFQEMHGRNFANSLELDSARLYFDQALKGYTAIGDKKGMATTNFKIAWVLKKRGDLKAAMQCDLKALKLMEELGDKAGIAGANNRISHDLGFQERYGEALAQAEKNIAFTKANNLETELMYAHIAAGDATIHVNRFVETFDHFTKALELGKKLNMHAATMVDLHNSVGNANKKLKRYKAAVAHYETALKFAQESGYTNGLGTVSANLGEINMLLGNYPKALEYHLKTLEISEKSGDLQNLTENYSNTSKVYEKLGNYPKALEFQRKTLKIRDSISKIESDKAMSEMLTKYQSEKKEATIAAQHEQLSNQRLVNWLVGGFVILLLGFLVFGYRSYRARTISNKLLEAKNAENELLMKEIHHRVKNNLELVKSLIALQSAHIEDSATKEAMIESQNRVQSMGIIHQKLYQGTNLGSIEMKDYFANLSEGILDSFNAEDRIEIEFAMENLELDIDTAVPIGLIVNELLTNSLKYAFPDNSEGKINISLTKDNLRELVLVVSDDGVGKALGAISKGTGFGTQLVQLLTIQLNGVMHENSENGTQTSFRFKTKMAA